MSEEVLTETEQVHLLPLFLPFNLEFCKLAGSALHFVWRAALSMLCYTVCASLCIHTKCQKVCTNIFLKAGFTQKVVMSRPGHLMGLFYKLCHNPLSNLFIKSLSALLPQLTLWRSKAQAVRNNDISLKINFISF